MGFWRCGNCRRSRSGDSRDRIGRTIARSTVGAAGLSRMTANVTPLHDRILVTRLEAKEVEKSGIIIPDTAKEKPQEGEVVAVGPGKIEKGRRVPIDVKVGDRILFGKYTGSDINIDDQEYLILREEEILAKFSIFAKAAGGKK